MDFVSGLMYQQHTGSPSTVADIVAACPQGVQPEPDLVAATPPFPDGSHDQMRCLAQLVKQ